MRTYRRFAALAATALLASSIAGVASAAATDDADGSSTFEGKLDDGTDFGFEVPDDWNGTVFVDLDYYGSSRDESTWLVDNGYAVGGTERGTVGYAYRQAAANMVEALHEMEAAYGEADTAVVWGRSRGGFVARATIEQHPGEFDGALAACGGGNGVVATFNQKLDAVFTVKHLVDVEGIDDLEVVGISNAFAQQGLLGAIVNEAAETPEGRARVALAAAFSQMQPWSNASLPRPGPRDWEGQADNILSTFAFGHPAVVRGPIEQMAGGVFSWNDDVDYEQLFARSERKQLVRALYDEAGLDLDADLATLQDAPRISADPDAVSFVEQNVTYTGELTRPILTLHTIGDPADPVPMERGYTDTVRQAGSNRWLGQAYVDRPGHCNFRPSEVLAGLLTVVERIDAPSWRNSTTPSQLDALASQLDAGHALDLGEPEFVRVSVPKPLRAWDVDNWGTYTPQ